MQLALRDAFDPKQRIANPGKIFPTPRRAASSSAAPRRQAAL